MEPKNHLVRIAKASLAAADPYTIVSRSLRLEGDTLRVQASGATADFDLVSFPRVFVLGFGKASASMAKAVEDILGQRITRGLIVVKPGQPVRLERVRQVLGGHPVPDENSVQAARMIADLADEANESTLVIVLISGGGSSLLSAPNRGSGLTLADIRETTRQLLACGAEISEFNCVRKHLLLLAGGRLAERIAPARAFSIILSDVVGNDLQTIASGPTVADVTTFAQACSIIEHYGISSTLPPAVVAYLRSGEAGKATETPKAGTPKLSCCRNFLAGTNRLALDSAAEEASRLGYRPLVLTSRLTGEAREAARVLAAIAKEVATTDTPCRRPACLLAGGETTVTIRGQGKGGRNQELALAFLWEIEKDPGGLSGASLLCFSTDGEDGPTDAAGGFALPFMIAAARARRISIPEALRENDSNRALANLGGLFVTGPTGTNVCDILIALICEETAQ
jgi:hydroxypyruvate reductase